MTDRPLHQRLFRMFVGALVGFGLCLLAAKIGFIGWVKGMPGEDIASTLVALMFVLLGVFAAFVSTNQEIYKRVAENYREGDPLDAGVLRVTRMNAVLLVISGAMLLAPPFAVRLGAGEETSIAVAAGVGVLLLVSTWLSRRVTRKSDELSRALSVESSAVCFWVLSVALFGWAALVKLGLAPEIGSWTLLTIAMAVSFVVPIVMAIRRGMFA